MSAVQEGIGRQPLATMLAPRCSMGTCTLDAGARVIVCGGYDRGECLRSVEQYDAVANVWTPLAPMCRDRGRCSAAVALNAEGECVRRPIPLTLDTGETRIYVLGGSDGNADLNTLESYDLAANKWTKLATKMTEPRSHHS